jgi:hypothetical protein
MKKSKNMKKLIVAIILFSVTGLQTVCAQLNTPKWLPEKTEKEAAYISGAQAYIYYYAPYYLYSLLYRAQQIPYAQYKNGVPFNVWTKVADIGNARNTTTVMPNSNTLYASAWFDLRKEPLILEVPQTDGKYYSIALIDAYGNNFSIIGSRTIGHNGGKFLIASTNYSGPIPAGMKKIVSNTPLVWVIERIAPDHINSEEIARCRAIQDKITITPMSQYGNKSYDPMEYNSKLDLGDPGKNANPFGFFEIGQSFTLINTPPVVDRGLLSTFSRIGLDLKTPFDPGNLTAPQKEGLKLGMQAGEELMLDFIMNGEEVVNGWNVPSAEGGNFGTNYLMRAALTMQSVGMLVPEEALYFTAYEDGDRQKFDGKNNYVIHFNKDEIPETDSFWSLTLYELPGLMFYDNKIDRYQIGPQIEEMKYNKDGSLDIYIGQKAPKGKESNWLPCPAGPFMMTMRIYTPGASVFKDGRILKKLPPVQLSKNQ